MSNIAEFLKRKLQHLNDTTRVSVPKIDESEEAAILRVKKSMEKWNALVDKIGAENSEELKVSIPREFQKKPTTYEITASKNHFLGDGRLAGKTSLTIEISL